MKILIVLVLSFITTLAQARDHYDIWPRIPFNIEGANLCEFTAAYSQTRSQYMAEMVDNAQSLLYAGDINPAKTMESFNRMYQRNLAYAKVGLGVTLENTFKSFLDSYYRKLRPKNRKLRFKFARSLDEIINLAIRGNQVPNLSNSELEKIDLIAYGTYSISDKCNGNVAVTLTIINRDGHNENYYAKGSAETVMSKIASKFFEEFQRTKFPSTINSRHRKITLIGGLNGGIDSTSYLEEAESTCKSLGGRLPTESEYKSIDNYGDWSGGITLGRLVWAMKWPYVFVPYFERNPVRDYTQAGAKQFYYTCVK